MVAMMKPEKLKILVVEDDPAHLDLIRQVFESAGDRASISMAFTLEEYQQQVAVELPDIVLMDLNLPDGLALDALVVPAEEGAFPVLVMTAHGNENQAVTAMKAGAFDYLVKSKDSFMAMPQTVKRALREWRLLQERRQVAVALARSEERYRNLYRQFHTVFEGVPDPLLLLTPDVHIEWANQAALEMLGSSHDDMVDASFTQVLQQHFNRNATLPVLRCFEGGEIDELHLDSHDGRVWSVRVLPIRETDGTISRALVLFQDVAQKMRAQSDAIRASQLAALGELAAGVAHEINNPVNGVINYAQILVNRLAADLASRGVAERIIHEGERIATIVSSLLTFARPQTEQRQWVALSDVLADCLSLAGAQLRQDGIVLRLSLPEDLPPVLAIRTQLQQVFLNLISNARYALNEKYPTFSHNKTIEVTADRFRDNENQWIRLTFTDYGSGISEASLARVLHPFFTTKPATRGTGLGLSISHGIIKNHAGRLSVASDYGKFTAVTIDLPCSATTRGI